MAIININDYTCNYSLYIATFAICPNCKFKADVTKTSVPSDGFNGFCPKCGTQLITFSLNEFL